MTSEYTSKVEYYSMIWKFHTGDLIKDEKLAVLLNGNYLRPMKHRRDKTGKEIYGRDGKPWLEYMAKEEILTHKTLRWSTENAELQKLPKDKRDLLGKMKLFLCEEGREVLIVHHAQHRNPCTKRDTSHLHIITHSVRQQMLSKDKTLRQIQYSCRKNRIDLKIRTQKIMNLQATMAYLRADGYTCMGCNSKDLMKAYKSVVPAKVQKYWCTELEEQSSEDEEAVTTSTEVTEWGVLYAESPSPPHGKRTKGEFEDGDEEQEQPVTKKSRSDFSDSDDDTFIPDMPDDVHDEPKFLDRDDLPDIRFTKDLMAAAKKSVITETPKRKLSTASGKEKRLTAEDTVRMIFELIVLSGANSEPELRQWCGHNQDQVRELMGIDRSGPFGPFIAILSRNDYQRLFNLAMMEAKTKRANYPNIIEYMKDNPLDPNVEVCTAQESAINFILWLELLGLNSTLEIFKILSVLLKKNNARNCYCVHGNTTMGKTYWFTKPFQYLPACVRGEVGQDERFAFETCANKLIILQDECNITRITAQRYKMILRGDPVCVDVKHKEPVEIRKTPIIMLTNKDPTFDLPLGDAQAIKERLIYTELPVLSKEVIQNFFLKADNPNPHMWIYLYENADPLDIQDLTEWADRNFEDCLPRTQWLAPKSKMYMTQDEIDDYTSQLFLV